MAHHQQQEFCKLINKFFFKEKKIAILEIGSCNVNGTIRNIFTNNIKYIGADVAKGPDVDVVYDGLNLEIKDKFDLSILENTENTLPQSPFPINLSILIYFSITLKSIVISE